jgi:hypothetical protein
MSVRSGLLASFLVFVMALVVLGAWSAWHLRELGGASRRIIADNYDSVVAAQDMKESPERQDSAALFILLGEDARRRRSSGWRAAGSRPRLRWLACSSSRACRSLAWKWATTASTCS